MHRKWWTLIVVSVATFMLLLDITVVNTALPAIQEDLGATFTELQWVIDAYTLALAALVLSAGVLADRSAEGGCSRPGSASSLSPPRWPASHRPDVPQPLARPPGRWRGGDVRRVAGARGAGVQARP